MSISHVLFKSAFIHDVAAIAEKARRVGAITVIDGYQAVGTIPVDVRAAGYRRLHRRLLEMAVRRSRRGVRVGRSAAAPPPGAEAHRLDVPPAAVRLRDRARAPRRCLALPPWHSQHPRPLRGPTRPGDRQPGRNRRDPRQVAAADRAAARARRARKDTAARLRATRSRRGGTVAIDVENGYEISESLKVARHPLRLPPRRGHPALTPLLQSRR